MITYVNTVLVANNASVITSGKLSDITSLNNGSFVVVDQDGKILSSTTASNASQIKIGRVDGIVKGLKGESVAKISWSNIIKKDDIKSYIAHPHTSGDTDSEDTVVLDFSEVTVDAANRYVLRLTYKDLPTRFRKWTESYEVSAVSSAAELAKAFAGQISDYKNAKRARVEVEIGNIDAESEKFIKADNGTALQLVAMPYDDDNATDENINVANKIRFSANAWMTKPEADGFASKNKYSIDGLTITKTEGKWYQASAKLVRDREYQAMGYQGILNRGECTWPIIKPKMNTLLDGAYGYIIIEFENMYRTADDLHRKTKQTVEIYADNTAINGLKAILDKFVA